MNTQLLDELIVSLEQMKRRAEQLARDAQVLCRLVNDALQKARGL